MQQATAHHSPTHLYLQAAFWFILSGLISSMNDALMRLMGSELHYFEIIWFRFFFGALTLFPIMLYIGKSLFKTQTVKMHILRGTLFYFAIAAWCFALTTPDVKVTLATTMSFTIPIFILILARFFLKETVNKTRWAAALLGLVGILVSLNPFGDFNEMALILLVSVVIFATLDIINKVLVSKEPLLGMIFYSTLVSTLLGIFPLFYIWETPTASEIGILLILGAGGNLVIYCILRAFHLASVSSLGPLRYVEFLFSTFWGFVLFREFPENATLWGCAIIIPATLYLGYSESRRNRKG